MAKKAIKPSALFDWSVVKKDEIRHSQEVIALSDKRAFKYFYDGIWHPHRKPTKEEIRADKFE